MLIVSLLSLTLASVILALRVRNLLRTTLVTAAGWSLAGVSAWWLAVVCRNLQLTDPGTTDVFYYSTAVLLLCPGIAVLGARRPGAGAWSFFVLFPLVAVLLWPALASSQFLKADTPLELEAPALIGFGLVLVMGTGNYFGTRFTLPAMLYAAALLLLVAPMSASVPDLLPSRETARPWAAVALALSTGLAALRAGEKPEGLAPLDRLWLDFVDSFGLVWAKRVMDRLNEAARHENWAAEFHWHGIVWNPDTSAEDRDRTEARIEHTLRWLLNRFVHAEWIDERLANATAETSAKVDPLPGRDRPSTGC